MRVVWETAELDRLTEYYTTLGLDEQRIVAAIVENVNALLAADPYAVGEGRGENFRVLIRSPMTFYYEVAADGVRVTKYHVSTAWPRRG